MNILSDDDRRVLGIDGCIVGEGELADFRAVAEGRGAVSSLSLATLVTSSAFATPRLDVPARVGLELSFSESRGAVVRVVDSESRPLAVRTESQAEGAFAPDARDPGTVYVDLDAAGLVAVGRDDGRGVLLRRTPNGVLVVDFHPPGVSVPPLAPVDAPLGMLAMESGKWVSEEVARLGNAGPLGHVIAVGLIARLTDQSASASELVGRLLNGKAAGTTAVHSRSWARDMSAEQAETVADLALVVVDRVWHLLDELWERMAPQEEWWIDTFTVTALERDDLECARVVLAERGEANRIAASLDVVDSKGREISSGMPYALSIASERLYRARLADPDAWWACFASPEWDR